jgi:hypothetical protein
MAEEDLLDQVASQPQAATPPPSAAPLAAQQQTTAAPAQQQPAAQSSGGDLLDDVASQEPQGRTGSMADTAKSWWDWTDRSILQDPNPQGFVAKHLASEDKAGQQIIFHEISSAHPWRAAMAQMYYGSLKDAVDVGQQLTTPRQLVLNAVSAGRGVIAKTTAMLANTYFAYKGAQSMSDHMMDAMDAAENLTKGNLEGNPESVQKFLFGTSALVGGTAGAVESGIGASDAMRARVQKKLGISGDLSAQVARKVQEAHEIRQRGVQRAQAVTKQGVQDVSDILDASTIKQATALKDMDTASAQIPVAISQMMKDAIPVVLEQQAKVSKPFEDMNKMTDDPVTDNASMRASMLNTIKAHGIQDQEIPANIFDALADRGKVESEDRGTGDLQDAMSKMKPDDPRRTALQSQVDAIQGQAATNAAKPVSFSDVSRVRNDVWRAAQRATDPRIRGALLDTLDTVTKMQEDFAVKNNFGNSNRQVTIDGKTRTVNDMLDNAKLAYMKFKRELGSDIMEDFTAAETLRQQKMGDALSKYMSPSDGPVIKDLMRMAGVDTKPLDELLALKSEAGATIKEGGKSATAQASKAFAATTQRVSGKSKTVDAGIKSKTVDAVNDLGKKSPIIDGKSDYALLGKSNPEIRREKLQALADNAQRQGITNPYAGMLIVLGLLRSLTSPISGAFMTTRGVAMGQSRNMVNRTLKNPSFQDWAIKEMGVHPTNTTRIQKLRDAMSRMRLTAIAGASEGMTKQQDNSPTSFRAGTSPSDASN